MRPTAITMPWADGEFTFDLRLGEVRKIQDKTGVGPGVVLMRLQSDQWKVDDYRETIMQGLLGYGMPVEKVRTLVHDWVDERPAKESLLPAQAILMSFIVGGPEGKKDAPKTESETTMAPDGSTSTQSMGQVLPSDFHQGL